MKQLAISILLTVLATVSPLAAQSFSTQMKDGNTVFFTITDAKKHTVEVSRRPALSRGDEMFPRGALTIPSSVRYRDAVWSVTAIADKAFEGAAGLESVSLPTALTRMGSSAFANCTSLRGVVFSGSQIQLPRDAFSGCTALENITFGGDWTEVDLAVFKDSQSLRTIRIPARVKQINNLKALVSLENVEVDGNNPNFASVDGLLYSKDGKTLYACPRGRSGSIEVKEGTETILEGAILDCSVLERVVLPATVTRLSYLEFSRCANLVSLTLLSDKPLATARREGAEVFCLRRPSDALTVYVPLKSLMAYRKALCTDAGHYENLEGRQKAYYQDKGFLKKNAVKAILKTPGARK